MDTHTIALNFKKKATQAPVGSQRATVINEYIRRTRVDDFALFEKYPDYVFNFTGSPRYNMMKEYYPDLYKKVADYIRQGRWYVAGSSVDEAEVNISSSEIVKI